MYPLEQLKYVKTPKSVEYLFILGKMILWNGEEHKRGDETYICEALWSVCWHWFWYDSETEDDSNSNIDVFELMTIAKKMVHNRMAGYTRYDKYLLEYDSVYRDLDLCVTDQKVLDRYVQIARRELMDSLIKECREKGI